MKNIKKLAAFACLLGLLAVFPVGSASAAGADGLTVERIACGIQNAWLVSNGDCAYLVDTGTAMYKNKVLRACRGKNVTLIVLTHGHHDHAQNAAFLSEKLGAPVAMHPADLPLIDDIMNQPLQGTEFTSKCLVAILKLARVPGFGWINLLMNTSIEPFALGVELREGLSLKAYGIDARITELPGHTLGSVGLVTADGLFAGDALTNLFGPGITPLFTDWDAMEASAVKASGLGALTVYPGHGAAMENRAWVPEFTVEQLDGGLGSCYILSQYGGGSILIDTGMERYREAILAACRENDVALIVLTHGHHDHAQNAAWLARELGVPVAMHPADIPLLGGLADEPLLAHTLFGRLMAAVIRLGYHPVFGRVMALFQNSTIPPFTPEIQLKDGLSLKKYGVDAKVIALPGHTMGSVGVLAGDILLAGDAVMNMPFPAKAPHYADRAAMEASVEMIAGMGGITVYPGHGVTLHGGEINN